MSSRGGKVLAIKKEVLDDLASRFLINLSEEDRRDVFKLCSQVELAHWFYLDLVRPDDHTLPGCSFKEFMATVFDHCPFLVDESMSKNLDTLIAQWKADKYKKPVRGAIILNTDLTKCLLVQGYAASTSWGFPKGKKEEGEGDMDTAVREVYEETGFDSRDLISKDEYLEATINDSHSRMYIIHGVSENTKFEPKTRKEISNFKWFSVYELPAHKKDISSKLSVSANKFFLVIPFISKLRRWIATRTANKKRGISASFSTTKSKPPPPLPPTAITPSAPPRVTHHPPPPLPPTAITPSAPPRVTHHPPPLLPTPQNIIHPIPYPSPHPHHPPRTNYTRPAPLQQSQTGQIYQGTQQYTNVYPSHLAFPSVPGHPAQRGPRPVPVVLLPTPVPMYVTRPSTREQVASQSRRSAGVYLSPSLFMTQFRFKRDLVLAASRATLAQNVVR